MTVRWREFIAMLGAAAVAWPLVARAQQPVPVIGVLGIGSQDSNAKRMASFRNGLGERGFFEGRNVMIETRYGPNGQYDRLLELAFDLVRYPVSVLVAIGSAGVAHAAEAATTTIPIVFANGSDPVKVGLVASMNAPGGNATGVSFCTSALGSKRLELLRMLMPHAATIAFLVNPTNPVTEEDTKDLESAARDVRQRIIVVEASNVSEIDAAFATINQERVEALIVDVDAFFLAGSNNSPFLQRAIGFRRATITATTSSPVA